MSLWLSVAAGLTIATYLGLSRRYEALHGRAWSRMATVAFAGGVAVLTAALGPKLDRMADGSFAWHMAQHMAIVFVVAPLLLCGLPVLLVLGALPRRHASVLSASFHHPCARLAAHPLFAWIFFIAVLWGTHFSSLYERALERPWLHVTEHALYLAAGLLFWQSVVRSGPGLVTLARPLQAAYVFAAIPPGAFLGLALFVSQHPLYGHYVHVLGSSSAALQDQQNGAALMWLGGGLILFSVFIGLVARWAAEERRRDELTAEVLD